MNLAQEISKKSHCVKKQVGAVIVKDTRVISTGYNGPPAGTYNCDEKWPETGCPRSARGGCSFALHAEHNAILYAMENNTTNLMGSDLYVTLSPCLSCAKVAYSVGIKRVFFNNFYSKYKNIDVEEGIDFLKEFGVRVINFDLEADLIEEI